MSGLLSYLHVHVSYCYSACIHGGIYSKVNGFHKAVRADGRGGWTGISSRGGIMQQIYHLFLHAMISMKKIEDVKIKKLIRSI